MFTPFRGVPVFVAGALLMLVASAAPLAGQAQDSTPLVLETLEVTAERIRAVPAGQEVAGHLRVPSGTPLLCVDRIAFTYGDMPVEWRRGLCLTDGFSYFNELA